MTAKVFDAADPEAEWNEVRLPLTREAVLVSIVRYLPFAWDKASGCRGLSAGRSIAHFVTWFWLLGEDEFSAKIDRDDEFKFYGKPQLVAVSEHADVQFDWRAADNGCWRNDESSVGITAEEALR